MMQQLNMNFFTYVDMPCHLDMDDSGLIGLLEEICLIYHERTQNAEQSDHGE